MVINVVKQKYCFFEFVFFCNYLVGSQLFLQIACLNEFGLQKKMVEKHCVKPLKSQLFK